MQSMENEDKAKKIIDTVIGDISEIQTILNDLQEQEGKNIDINDLEEIKSGIDKIKQLLPTSKSNEEFKKWVKNILKLNEYYAVFVENGVESLSDISKLTMDDLKECGITKVGHRRRIFTAIGNLQKSESEQEEKLDSIYQKPASLFPENDKQHIHWGYDEHNGPHCWGDLSHQNVMAIKGKQQSPINIISRISSDNKRLRNTISESQDIGIIYPEYYNECFIVNNGHTVQVNVNNGGTLTLYNKEYQLKQFHFHTPSEHTVDAKPYDLEMHLVHVNPKDNSLAVLGFFFCQNTKPPQLKQSLSKMRMNDISEEKDDDDNNFGDGKTAENKGNEFLAQFEEQLPHSINTKHPIKLAKPLTFDPLFEACSVRFKRIETNQIEAVINIFHYEGSLTTPPCSEGVKWLVSMKPQWATTKQVHQLKGCWNYISNARPIQEYHGRVVTLCSKLTIHH